MIICLLLPIHVNAEPPKIAWQADWELTNPANVLVPNRNITDELFAAYTEAQSRSQRPSYGRYSCVAWAKHVTGVYGTWGNGGHYLSLNSNGQIGDVIIFKGEHVAVITARVGSNLTITEANFDWLGHIRTRTLEVTDSSIKGFHSF